jgi:hypothetical protein
VRACISWIGGYLNVGCISLCVFDLEEESLDEGAFVFDV